MTRYFAKNEMKLLLTISFNDSSSISNWAEEAVKNIQQSGLMKGNDENQFIPDGNTSRAELSVVVVQFSQLLN